MYAIWLENKKLSVREDLPVPDRLSGEALVRVLRAGICNTDIELTRGYYPFTGVIGHEFVGLVDSFFLASSNGLMSMAAAFTLNGVINEEKILLSQLEKFT